METEVTEVKNANHVLWPRYCSTAAPDCPTEFRGSLDRSESTLGEKGMKGVNMSRRSFEVPYYRGATDFPGPHNFTNAGRNPFGDLSFPVSPSAITSGRARHSLWMESIRCDVDDDVDVIYFFLSVTELHFSLEWDSRT